MPEKRITIKATRYDPEKDEKPRLQSYEIPFYDESMVVLDALNYIKSNVDGSLSYRWSCRMGICGSCGMMVNGTPKLTCNAFLRDYWPRPVVVEPLNNFPVIRDLVIDMDDFMHKLKAIKPWIIRRQEIPLGAGEHRQTNEQIDDFRQFSECINCMLCYAACPVYGLNNEFLGPAAIALWLLWLLVEIKRAGDGPARYSPHGSTAFVVFSVITLVFALYHSYTFLSLAGVIIHFKVLDRPLPSRLIVLAQFALWAVASVVVGFVLIWFAR